MSLAIPQTWLTPWNCCKPKLFKSFSRLDSLAVKDQFVHLHVHTEYSMLDGAARVKELLSATAELGMPAIAMTDHGNLFGAFDFYKQARQVGVKPIIGIEAYLAPESRFDRKRVKWADGGEDDVSSGGAYTHLTLLAKNNNGLSNLFKLASLASIEGYYYKPRMDKELLTTYAAGLIGTTGCVGGEIQTKLRIGDIAGAKKSAGEFQDIFGKENFYCELMDHDLQIEKRVQTELIDLAKKIGMPLLATNDLHYTYQEDAYAHEILLCVQSGSNLSDPKRFKFDGTEFYLKSPSQMRELFKDFPDACDNTLLIAEQCEIFFDEGANLMPSFPVPQGESEFTWLSKEVERGLSKRFPGGVPNEYAQRAKFELDVISQMGFPGYFLVVADLIDHARRNGIRVGPGRGSAAGAVVAWALRITEIDPIEHGLLFERFLNPERVSMPDIDIDFDERRRGEVIRYATNRYGSDRVAQIITYGTIKAKQAIKDSARVLGYPFAVGDKITKVLPPSIMGKDISLSGIFDADHERFVEASEFRALYDTDADVKRVVDTARGIEGLKRQWGVHAAGVILSKEPLMEVIPIQKRENDGAIITQFDMGACESLGLLKMDFLGLRNLTVLDDALINIEQNRGMKIVLEELPLDDRKTYELMSRGETLGVFQLDGGPMRSLLRSLAPTSFADITAVIALYRPGPMGANAHNDYADRKNGRKPVIPIVEEAAEALGNVLGDTYGLIVYQEQVMAIAQQMAGYSLGAADLLRRAMGKKKAEILEKEYVPFREGMFRSGYSEKTVKTLWDVLVPFADYAFNKSHAAGYALVSYWTGYLKANFPAEYMAALLTSVRDDKDKSALYLNECRRMGIKVLPPDVNESEAEFTPVDTDIRFGLSAVRNVGSAVVQLIIQGRTEKGRFTSFGDYLSKVDAQACSRKTVESLIKAGAFDSLGHTRRGLMVIHADAIESVMEKKRADAIGQFDLFGGSQEVMNVAFEVPVEEWDKSLLLAHERDMLGLYVSDHPLLGVEHVLARHVDRSIASVWTEEVQHDQIVTIGGLITGIQRKISRQGAPWAIVTLEDLEGLLDVNFYSNTYANFANSLVQDAIVIIRGRVDKREDQPRFIAMELTVPDISSAPRGPLNVSVPISLVTPPNIERLKEILRTHPGTTEVYLHLQSPGDATLVTLGEYLRVSLNPSLSADLKALFGARCLSSS